MTPSLIYRTKFKENNDVFFLYSKYISEESLDGFIELDGLVFNHEVLNTLSELNRNKIKVELCGVVRTYLPVSMIIRIDEVELGVGVAEAIPPATSNISHFPKDSTK
jgi:hypothetical protein